MGMTTLPDGTFATIDGQAVNIATQTELIEKILDRMKSRRGFTLFTLNLDHLVKRRANTAFRHAYERATFVTADGAPIVALARRDHVRIERTTGADLILPLCDAAARDGVPVYFFGSTRYSLERAIAQLSKFFPTLDIRGYDAPSAGFDPFSATAEMAGSKIARSGARLCFVALGAPKQELFADRMAATHDGIGFLCIGAALDFLSGEQVRAPQALRRTGLEWAWRLFGDPRRMALRYARCAALLTDLAILQPLQRHLSGATPSRGRVES
jgi:exopolysaccharide biosynthesis WecB/TagA/CpsF family protein